ncbi:phosphate acyltransferase [Ruegeria marina]|uniref:Phosphate acetyltransferase n=1 Tax=Ruegeria marina TaxID=639004 RepID=A0A1G7AAR3_9RHOB|nr:phosphate acyltransferase [Ruegeria marina]SDE11889.1 phosphate acetyltransferase [Ruegeria marina]
MTALDRALETARTREARVVFPEMDDPRVAAATAELARQGLCTPVGLGTPSQSHVAALVEARGVKEAVARRMLGKPLYLAAAMVACGEAEAMVAGADSPTKRVIEAASIAIGLAEGVSVPSSFFLMQFPDGRELIFADCAVNVAPDAGALAAIARASAVTAQALLGSARVALLSFSTGTSGAGDSVERVRAAAEATGFLGPVQADAALNPAIAARKGLGAGDANVLVFPDLDAGNIAYKLCQELAGAQALGPILQGFRKPVCDLSRGATVEDIVAATSVTLALG